MKKAQFPPFRICIDPRVGTNISVVKERLRQVLSGRQVRRIADSSRAPSAVLLPIFCKGGQCHILVTKRTEMVSTHKGQISFPGGAFDEGDGTLVNTALREACEEIGLMPGDVEILGELDDNPSMTSNYLISPFVGAIPWPYRFKLNIQETEKIIEVPIAALLKHQRPDQATEIIEGKVITSYLYHYQDNVIWGATARILNQFLDIFARLALDNRRG